jgi:hypothetical protein
MGSGMGGELWPKDMGAVSWVVVVMVVIYDKIVS